MKSLNSFIIGILFVFAIQLQAQVSVNINVGRPPLWGPIGYAEAQYYYLPDVEAYYDIPSSRFIYFERGGWVHRRALPARYRGYDLYNGYKVVMTDYHGKTPYIYFKDHKKNYAKGYHGHAQKTIGQRPGKGHSTRSSQASSQSKSRGNNKNKGQGGGKGKK